MSTAGPAMGLENLMLNVTEEIHVKASLETTFEALLEELGPSNTTPEGTKMQFKVEAWPGGRWYRDLGNNNGHCWGHVQAIRRSFMDRSSCPIRRFPTSSTA